MKTKEVISMARQAGLRVESGSKHLKLYTPAGVLVGVVSANPRRSGHDPHFIRRIVKRAV